MDPRTMTLGADRWLTDSRVYNLVWLGRWIERAQTVARVLLWAARQESAGDEGIDLEEVLGMAASVRGVSIEPGESALDVLMTRDSGAALRGCLIAARYNATHVAPVEVIRVIGEAIGALDDAEEPPGSTEEVASLIRRLLIILDQLHQAIEEAWFHSDVLSEEEAYRRFVQQ